MGEDEGEEEEEETPCLTSAISDCMASSVSEDPAATLVQLRMHKKQSCGLLDSNASTLSSATGSTVLLNTGDLNSPDVKTVLQRVGQGQTHSSSSSHGGSPCCELDPVMPFATHMPVISSADCNVQLKAKATNSLTAPGFPSMTGQATTDPEAPDARLGPVPATLEDALPDIGRAPAASVVPWGPHMPDPMDTYTSSSSGMQQAGLTSTLSMEAKVQALKSMVRSSTSTYKSRAPRMQVSIKLPGVQPDALPPQALQELHQQLMGVGLSATSACVRQG